MAKPLEPTVRQEDQQFPSKVQDGGDGGWCLSADGEYCRVPVWARYATNLIKIAACTKGIFIYFSFK